MNPSTIRNGRGHSGNSVVSHIDALLLEIGDFLLLETGDKLLLE